MDTARTYRLRKRNRRQTRNALLFISPWILGFLVFTLWPILYSGYLSLTDYDVLNDPNFVGLENYRQLGQDPRVMLSLRNTMFYAALSVPLHIGIALLLAMLLMRARRATGFFRTVFYLPNMTPPVAVGILLLLLFNGHNGLVNAVLGFVGIPGPDWTTDSTWIKPGLVLMSLWTLGGSTIILLAALNNVPRDLYDAALVDGAGPLRRFTSVTVPMISGTLFFLVIVNTIAALQSFTEAYTAYFGAGNGTYSNDAALFYVIYLFRQAFEYLNMGFASAMAWLLFAIIMVITAIQYVVGRKLVFYEGEDGG
ncbi:carbohydrate ABC transporter permease [Paeniglutamicibacter psychrophenolicus]|uniref:carbohydrate ABC transporter permease n=1 Tax=Paeniglutamicibacter psychrophenolicus TaxID=257454 RepID=UPI00277D1FD2|nr:sugar ABC transporter permease [Paeniglutamicibacter psychrophenolicus]MDQ0096103.1 multiple sugar transport system permease protein [Paeniglutamicibacter psychrophenolicus]